MPGIPWKDPVTRATRPHPVQGFLFHIPIAEDNPPSKRILESGWARTQSQGFLLPHNAPFRIMAYFLRVIQGLKSED